MTINGTPYTVHLRDTFAYGGRDGRVSKRDLQNFVNGPLKESFSQTFTYDPLGNLKQLTYPDCTHADCAAKVAFTVENAFETGLLTAVGIPGAVDLYARLAYHPNLLVSEVAHRVNGTPTVRDLQFNDPHSMRRPSSLQSQTPAGVVLWASGGYAYDGAGNIRSIGNSTFDYDRVSRLTSGTVDLAPTGAANLKAQSYTYDAFGNILSITTNGSQLLTPTSSATNRLNGAGSVYDAAGKLKVPQTWNRYAYTRNNPLAYVDPDGNESAGILLDQDNQALLRGELTPQEFRDRQEARATGALIGAVAGSGALTATSISLSSAGSFFSLAPMARGVAIETWLAGLYGGGLARNFPVIDRFWNGVATSVKSMDLTLRSYQNVNALTSRINGFVTRLATFKGASVVDVVRGDKIITRCLSS